MLDVPIRCKAQWWDMKVSLAGNPSETHAHQAALALDHLGSLGELPIAASVLTTDKCQQVPCVLRAAQ
jgi:hypothetical protein